mgnify:CR=1 FL=1
MKIKPKFEEISGNAKLPSFNLKPTFSALASSFPLLPRMPKGSDFPSPSTMTRKEVKAKIKKQIKDYQNYLKGGDRPERKRHDITESPIFGFDSEYQRIIDERGNTVLAYSYSIRHQGRVHNDLFKHRDRKGRMSFSKFFVKAIESAIKAEVLEEWPEHVVMSAFMIAADLFSFADAFKDFKTRLDGVRKSYVTINGDYALDMQAINDRRLDFDEQVLWDKNGNKRVIDISFYDLMLLSPAGFSLKKVGELVGLPKLDIDPPYSIERMAEFMYAQPELFDAYSIRDAEIAAIYMERMIDFCCYELGFNTVPYTIGGIGVKRFKTLLDGDFNEVFGLETVKSTAWSKSSSKVITQSKTVVTLLRSIFEQFAIEGYHGGRNESFLCGLSDEDRWKDYDAPSCYTVILNMLRPINYGSLRTSLVINDYIVGDKFGVAYVRFKHPEETKIPTLPVHAGSRGLIYPMEGETVVGAPEIEVAINAGCEVEIIQGVVGEWVENENRFFLPFMREVREQRNAYINGSFEERLWKEIGNSLYGKLAQGLRKRAVFDSKTGLNKEIPHSQITNPYFAMYVTSFARALMTEMMLGIDGNKHAIGSVTTDGFITTANLEKGEIPLNGPMCKRFGESYHMIESDTEEVLTKKHEVGQILFLKTRGQATVKPIEGEQPLQARAGVMLPKDTEDKHEFFNALSFNRFPGQKVVNKCFISPREIFLDEVELVSEDREVTLNLEWDCKRLLVDPRENSALGHTHIFCGTVPHKTVDDAMNMRANFDGWRVNRCLKTMDDWADWEDYFATRSLTTGAGIQYRYLKGDDGKALLTKDGQKIGEGSDGLLRRLFIRAFMQDQCGLDSDTVERQTLADLFTFYGYNTKTTEVRGGYRAKLVFGCVPVTEKSLKLLRLLLRVFPNFEFESLFDKNKIPELYRRLYSM